MTIFGSAYLEGDTDRSNLKDRLQGIAREAGLLVIGANCMGFVNYTAGARVTWMNVPEDGWFDPGHITLISHSGHLLSDPCSSSIRGIATTCVSRRARNSR